MDESDGLLRALAMTLFLRNAVSRLSDTSIRADSRQVQTKALKITQAVKREAGVALCATPFFIHASSYAGTSWKPNFAAFFFMYLICCSSYFFSYSVTSI